MRKPAFAYVKTKRGNSAADQRLGFCNIECRNSLLSEIRNKKPVSVPVCTAWFLSDLVENSKSSSRDAAHMNGRLPKL